MSGLELAQIGAAMAVAGGINGLWLGLLVTAVTAGTLRLLPRANAATRYAVWFVTLLLVAAAPCLLLIPRPAPATAPVSTSAAPLAVPVTMQWPMFVALGWAAISGLLLARVAWSLAHIQSLKRRATEIGRRDNIRVLESAEVRVPMVAGFWRPAVVFPQTVIAELSAGEFEQVLAHELAHLRRGDDWTQLVQAVIGALLFFHPAIYWIGRKLKIEREIACDDWVVAATGKARPYAACLTHLHEVTRRAPAPQLAPGATTRHRWQISARVEALLDPGRNVTPRFSRSGWVAACAVAGAALMVAATTAPPVGVQEVPLQHMTLAQMKAPAAPAISYVQRRAPAVARPVIEAKRVPELDAPVVLVNAWQVDVTPSYYVIAVIFFEPPPQALLNGI